MKANYWISLLLLGLGTAVAEPEGDLGRDGKKPRPRPPGEGGNRGFSEFLKRADTDGDGKVSKAEFMKLERLAKLSEEQRTQMFARIDKNEDGFLTAGETPMPNRPSMGPGGFPRLGELDKNRDGSVSYDEFLASRFVLRLPEDRRQSFFERLDRNGDGQLSPEDRGMGGKGRGEGRRPDEGRPEQAGKFEDLDLNADGFLDFEEFSKVPAIKARGEDFQEDRFEALDKNGDLKLQRNEFKEGAKSPAGMPRRGGAGGGNGPRPDGSERKGPPRAPRSQQ